jgi:hypothetical protein
MFWLGGFEGLPEMLWLTEQFPQFVADDNCHELLFCGSTYLQLNAAELIMAWVRLGLLWFIVKNECGTQALTGAA